LVAAQAAAFDQGLPQRQSLPPSDSGKVLLVGKPSTTVSFKNLEVMKTKICLSIGVLVLVVIAGLACRSNTRTAQAGKPLYYTCPMHRDVKVDHPGECPICKMALIPIYAEAATIQATAAPMSCCGAPAPASKP